MKQEFFYGTIDSDFLKIKMDIRRLVSNFAPENIEELNNALKTVDDLISQATFKMVLDDKAKK